MEAAGAVRGVVGGLRARAFERECVRLRPMGEAYVRRRFSGQLGDADAEDAVSEVLLRLHRQIESGRAPANLQAAFFTGVRNAAIDILRSRSARPTVGLEAVAEAVGDVASPFERAESAEDSVRLQEALGRMRGNYREAVVLRFGLGLTVPEIAGQMEISLPAAKKLVLRATAQARARLESIDEHEFCEEMRDTARRAVFDGEAAGVLDSEESKVLHAHFRHCGPCRSFLARLHEDLHELGGGVVVASGLGWHFGVFERARALVEGVGHLATGVHGRVRVLAYRVSGGFSSGDGPGAGAFASGQKVAAVCTAGVAGAATCLASGVVGPGIGLGGGNHASRPVPRAPAAKVRKVAVHHVDAAPSRGLVTAPAPIVEPPVYSPRGESSSSPEHVASGPRRRGTQAAAAKKSKPQKEKKAPVSGAEETESEFGFEGEAESSAGSSSAESSAALEAKTTQSAQSEPTTQAVPVPSSGGATSSSSSSSAASSSSSSSGTSSSGSSGGTDFGGFEK
jgi:RNA polymerase sigma factor (sigma-70 family)